MTDNRVCVYFGMCQAVVPALPCTPGFDVQQDVTDYRQDVCKVVKSVMHQTHFFSF